MSKNAKTLISLNTIKIIIDIFLGPFLTSYFFKLSIDSIKFISLYYIYTYIIIIIISFIIGIILKNKNQLIIFRLGIVFKFIQLIILILIGNNLTNYLWLVAILSGISTMMWAFPLNVFSASIIPNSEKKNFVVYKTVLSNFAYVIIPFVFGTLISIESFEKVAIVVLILSFIQIIISLNINIKTSNIEYRTFDLKNSFNTFLKNNNIKNLFKSDFFLGLTFEGALDTIITLIIIISFQKDFNLGLITSLSSILSIISAYICKKINNQKVKYLLYISFIIPLISAIILLLLTNQYTVIIYNIIYTFFIQIITIYKNIFTLKLANSKIINDSNRIEAYTLFEIYLGIGRILSFILLLIFNNIFEVNSLKILILIFTVFMGFIIKNLLKINVEIEVENEI